MDSLSSDQPSSILHVRASTMYPLPTNDDISPDLIHASNGACASEITPEQPPFPLLCGEAQFHAGRSVDGALVITNYRFYMESPSGPVHVPLGLIELVEVRDLFYLHVWCKDARSFRCTFDTNEQCSDWFRRLSQASAPPRQLPELFAFCFHAWACEREHEEVRHLLSEPPLNLEDAITGVDTFDFGFRSEVERLGFDLHGAWRISLANVNYRLCGSYPPLLLVPACISDDTLEAVARFRSSRRIPVVVWRHSGNGAIIARCSQPEVGWLGWRSSDDEDLLKAIADACAFDKGPRSIVDMGGGASAPHTPTDQCSSIDGDLGGLQERTIDTANLQAGKKVLIMDARSYTTAVANRARGGGCECPEYYPSCDIQFMNLANIHSIRKSFHALRQLCSSNADQLNWWSLLEGTRWLQHMSGLMRAAATLAAAVERDARPVLVHCSDGWDRTPQIVALAELLLDPYYRTIEGFRVLVEREWLAFGHKFADRCGQSGSDDLNERCPVFLQWLDCVHQLQLQFPCSFEFAGSYLVKLAQHTYSNLFGTFLCNTKQERVEHVNDRTFSVWRYLNTNHFRNHLYTSNGQVLWPATNVRDLKIWKNVYLGFSTSTNTNCLPNPPSILNTLPTPSSASLCQINPTLPVNNSRNVNTVCSNGDRAPPMGCTACNGASMTKTRSYGDLMGAAGLCPIVRRCSDPSITTDVLKMSTMNISGIEDNIQNGIEEQDDGIVLNDNLIQLSVMDETKDSSDAEKIKEEQLISEIKMYQNQNGDINITNNLTETNYPQVHQIQNGIVAMNGFENGLSKNYQNNYSNSNLTAVLPAEDVNNTAKFPLKCDKNTTDWIESEITNVLLLNVDLKVSKVEHNKSDINHNGHLGFEEDSDNENDLSESKSEVTLCNSPNVAVVQSNGKTSSSAKSNETSTDTLVAENGIVTSDVPESAETTPSSAQDGCEVCAQNRKLIEDKHFQPSRSTSGKNSRYSTPPPHTRTPSGLGSAGGGNGGGCVLLGGGTTCYTAAAAYGLDIDGLASIRSEVQHRLWQIQEEFRLREEALQRELHTTRKALIKQVCHSCNHNEGDKLDDTQSLVGSVCSMNDGQASVGDSLPSDLSWEAVDEGTFLPGVAEGLCLLPNGTSNGILSSNPRTLWVPDHAVSRCMGCHTEFWLGKRKHHCRNCGRIFCADCSENSAALPSEDLYKPVRVCTSCYSLLRRSFPNPVVELADKCKHSNAGAATTAANAQLTASSN